VVGALSTFSVLFGVTVGRLMCSTLDAVFFCRGVEFMAVGGLLA
jgi:hypothetical protein